MIDQVPRKTEVCSFESRAASGICSTPAQAVDDFVPPTLVHS